MVYMNIFLKILSYFIKYFIKIEKGVKTRPQYHFLIKSFVKKGTSHKIRKLTVTLILLPITIYTSEDEI